MKGLVLKTAERSRSPMLSYTKGYRRYLPGKKELERQREDRFPFEPLISIVIPAYETGESYLRELLDSLTAQTYENWELCLADGSRSGRVESVIKEYQNKEKRLHYKRLTKTEGFRRIQMPGLKWRRGSLWP